MQGALQGPRPSQVVRQTWFGIERAWGIPGAPEGSLDQSQILAECAGTFPGDLGKTGPAWKQAGFPRAVDAGSRPGIGERSVGVETARGWCWSRRRLVLAFWGNR